MVKIGGINCFTYTEVAKQLQIHPQTVARMVKGKRLRAVKIGRYNYIPFTALRRLIKGE